MNENNRFFNVLWILMHFSKDDWNASEEQLNTVKYSTKNYKY